MNKGLVMLGDAGASNSDYSYTGEVSDSVFSLDYYRTKANEFQMVLNALDTANNAAWDALESGTDEDTTQFLYDWLGEFDAKKTQLRLTAEAINAGAAVVNSMGGRFPQLSVPGTLAAFPLALPVAAIAAIGTAAMLATWGYQAIKGLNERLRTAQLLDAQATPEARERLALAIQRSDDALQQASGSIWSVAGGAVKWVAIAVAAFAAWRLYSTPRG